MIGSILHCFGSRLRGNGWKRREWLIFGTSLIWISVSVRKNWKVSHSLNCAMERSTGDSQQQVTFQTSISCCLHKRARRGNGKTSYSTWELPKKVWSTPFLSLQSQQRTGLTGPKHSKPTRNEAIYLRQVDLCEEDEEVHSRSETGSTGVSPVKKITTKIGAVVATRKSKRVAEKGTKKYGLRYLEILYDSLACMYRHFLTSKNI